MTRRGTRALLAGLVAATAVLAGCGGGSQRATAATCGPPAAPRRLVPQVVRELPHDPTAFTQGLVVADGVLYESTGLVGRSTLRSVDPSTGRVLASRRLPPTLFAEGLAALPGRRLVQLTWKDGIALRWRHPVDGLGPFRSQGRFAYDGEGWGLTRLGDGTLAMSDGSDRIAVRDAEDFRVLDRWRVRRADGPTDQLNELEWDGRRLWANRWQTDEIVRIDVRCRRVDAVVDATALTARASAAQPGVAIDVLNGIAHLPGTDRSLVTGKLWPVMFEVRFVPG